MDYVRGYGKHSGSLDPRKSAGGKEGVMVPGSPRSEHLAKSCEGSKQVDGLPVDSQPGYATAVYVNDGSEEENIRVKSIVDRYLGKGDLGAAASSSERGDNNNDDNMSVSSVGGHRRLKRTRDDKGSVSDSDVESHHIGVIKY